MLLCLLRVLSQVQVMVAAIRILLYQVSFVREVREVKYRSDARHNTSIFNHWLHPSLTISRKHHQKCSERKVASYSQLESSHSCIGRQRVDDVRTF